MTAAPHFASPVGDGGELRVAVYLRISTDEEHQPFSLDAQEHRLGAFVASQPGWTLARAPYVDQTSGAKADRPALARLLRDARLGLFDVVLVYRVDRFARSLKVLVQLLEDLDAAGVAFRSATEPIDTSTPTGRMLVQLLGVFAEFERATIIDRVVAGMERKAARGEWPTGRGSRPYGYTVDPVTSQLVPHPDERAVVELIFRSYVRGRLGARSIATVLNERGHRTRSGRPWSTVAVLTVLRNRAYVGEIHFRDTWHPSAHEPLVEAEVFAAAQAVLADRAADHAKWRTNSSDYLATGKIVCARCEHPYLGTRATGNRYTYRYYTCYTRQRYGTASCGSDRIPADALDRALLESLLDAYADSQLVADAAERAAAVRDANRALLADELAAVEAEQRKTDDAIERYLLAFEAGTLPQDKCGERVRALADRATELRARHDDLNTQLAAAPPQPPTADELEAVRQRVHDALTGGDLATRKALVQELVEAVVVHGRDRIQPYYRLPGVTNGDAPQVREVSGVVRRQGLEPRTRGLREDPPP